MDMEKLSHEIGENVVYKHSVYVISDIRKDKICGINKTYYVLKSVYDDRASVYVPADSEALVKQMEKILSKQEVHGIIDESRKISHEWKEVNAERAVYFEEVIASENLPAIISLYKLLTKRKEETLKTRCKMFAHDERMLQSTKQIMAEAFAFSLGLDKKEVIPYVTEYLEAVN